MLDADLVAFDAVRLPLTLALLNGAFTLLGRTLAMLNRTFSIGLCVPGLLLALSLLHGALAIIALLADLMLLTLGALLLTSLLTRLAAFGTPFRTPLLAIVGLFEAGSGGACRSASLFEWCDQRQRNCDGGQRTTLEKKGKVHDLPPVSPPHHSRPEINAIPASMHSI